MENSVTPLTILVADDDPDDRLLIQEAFEEVRLINPVDFVNDGIELMDYLHQRNGFASAAESDTGHRSAPLPGMILLDLNMPRMDGREALEKIKNDPNLCRVPVIVLTTSKGEEDILRTYDLGANSFIPKPVTFDGLVEVIKALNNYWLQIVVLPPQ